MKTQNVVQILVYVGLVCLLASCVADAQTVYDLNAWNGDIRILGKSSNNTFGYRMACGDFNDDGKSDVLVVAPGANCAYVFYGSDSFPADHVIDLAIENADITIVGRPSRSGYGMGIGDGVSRGDINADGIDDILLGSRYRDPFGRSWAGEAYVIFGRTNFPLNHVIDLNLTLPDITVYGDDADA